MWTPLMPGDNDFRSDRGLLLQTNLYEGPNNMGEGGLARDGSLWNTSTI